MSQYSVGTVSFVNNSAVVVGAGTQWSTQLAANQLFALKGSTIWYQILSIQSDTQLTLTSVYAGPTAAAQSYVAQRDFTATRNYPTPTFGDVQSASLIANTMLQLETELTTMSAAAQAMNGSITVEGSLIVSGTGFAFNDVPITGSTIDSTTIGATTPAAGHFTSLSTTGAASFGNVAITGGAIDSTTIGATTPAAGTFSSLRVPTGTLELGAGGAYQSWNLYYSAGWTYRYADYGYVWRHNGNTLSLSTVPSGAAGATAAITTALSISGDTGVVSFPSGALAPSDWGFNRLINGDLNIWQTGTSFTVANNSLLYTADQWIVQNYLTGVSVTVSRTALSYGAYWGINASANGVAVNGVIAFEQPVESQRLYDLDSQPCTVSFNVHVSTSAGTLTGYVQFAANTGIDNSSFSNFLTSVPFTVPSGYNRVSVTLPAGSTAGINNGGKLNIGFSQAGAIGNVNITINCISLERGTVASPWHPKPSGVEWSDCERFFETSYSGSVPGSVWPLNADGLFISATATSHRFRTRKRAAPTLTIYDTSGAAGKVTYYTSGGGWANGGGLTVAYATMDAMGLQNNSSGTIQIAFQFSANSRL